VSTIPEETVPNIVEEDRCLLFEQINVGSRQASHNAGLCVPLVWDPSGVFGANRQGAALLTNNLRFNIVSKLSHYMNQFSQHAQLTR
jgi:hypothetical protein